MSNDLEDLIAESNFLVEMLRSAENEGSEADVVRSLLGHAMPSASRLESMLSIMGDRKFVLFSDMVIDYDKTDPDGGWDEGHPIFKMAQEVDALKDIAVLVDQALYCGSLSFGSVFDDEEESQVAEEDAQQLRQAINKWRELK